MKTQHDTLRDTLNELIEINHSRIDGYKKAISDVTQEDLQGLFGSIINESDDFAESLAEYVVKLGGEPSTSSMFLGKVHQVWLDFKAALSSKNRHTILNSCEFGDTQAIKAYDLALEMNELSEPLRALLIVQRTIIAESLDIIRSLMKANTDTKSEIAALDITQ